MEIKLTYYGQLAELVGFESETFKTTVGNVALLKEELIKKHPELKNRSFQLAANNEILNDNEKIEFNAVDLFPPFSGG